MLLIGADVIQDQGCSDRLNNKLPPHTESWVKKNLQVRDVSLG